VTGLGYLNLHEQESLAAFTLFSAIGHRSCLFRYRISIVLSPPLNDRGHSPQLCCDNHHDIRRWQDVM
jgi:hypothetical protein